MKKEKYEQYLQIVNPILNHEEFLKRKNYRHHKNKTVYEHSMQVSLLAYRMSKYLPKVDEKSVAIAGMLHDFYDKPWMDISIKKPFFQKHGFVHAKEARENAYKYFPELMNKKIENMILRHMFPLNIVPPKYIESWIITIADKIVSVEVLFQPETLINIFIPKKGSE